MVHPRHFIFPVVMAVIMSFIMSGIITAMNIGFTADYVAKWMGAWMFSGPMAVIGVMIMRPVAARISDFISARLFPEKAEA